MSVSNPVTVTVDPSVILSPAAQKSASVNVLLSSGKFTAENAEKTAEGFRAPAGTAPHNRALDNLVARGLIARSSWTAARGFDTK